MKVKSFSLSVMMLLVSIASWAQFGVLSPLHVEGAQLQDEQGNRVVLHGVMDTPSPYFNNGRWGSSASVGYVDKCIDYFNTLYSAVTDTLQGAYCNVFRLHLDPCWCFTNATDESNYEKFNFSRFKQFWEKLYRPLILNGLKHGLYIIVRPPGVCPSTIQVGDDYQEYLKKVWGHVSQDDSIKKYSGYVMIELANEPVDINNASGRQDNTGSAPHDFFQPICDLVRANGFTGILWVPGAGYQSIYNGYVDNPITGYNIGYAVHDYPGWYSSDEAKTADDYIASFEKMVPVVKTKPVIITEVDWSPEKEGEGKYNEFGEWVPANHGTWGTATTSDWGNKYKALIDKHGISMTLTGTADYLDIDQYIKDKTVVAAFKGVDEACGEACLQWYKDYSKTNYAYKAFARVRHSDQGDGTYINPIINADFPDPDVIRVGDTFYMLSTTFHHLPGATLLKSKDLVNWEYCANPLEQLVTGAANEKWNKYNLLNGESAYAEGMWASALGYDNGTYYILISSLDVGGALLTATDPAGPWTYRKLNDNFYDCGMLFEGDNVYVACGINSIHVVKLDKNFNRIEDKEVINKPDAGLEGNKIYHIGNYYYIYNTYGGTEGSQTIFRSSDPMGPYTEVDARLMKGQHIHQGALVDTQNGEWWTILFKDDGAIGRVPYLEPVTWIDEWPVIGTGGTDVSKGGVAYQKPNVGQAYPRTLLPTNDTFTDLSLGLQWQWNHQPDNAAWSLADNPGCLRLYTTGTAQNLMQARNSLTQRMIALSDEGMLNSKKPMVYGTVKMDISNMADGDVAGLSVFQDPYSWVGVKNVGGTRHLYVFRSAYDSNAEYERDLGEVTSDVVYLQARANFGTNKVIYYYSTDNETYSRAGSSSFDIRFIISIFAGQRFYLFNYATKQNGGYVDFDWFTTEQNFTESTYYSPERLQTFTAEDLQLSYIDAPSSIETLNGGDATLSIYAVMKSGLRRSIANSCTYSLADNEVATISGGIATGKKEGETLVTATYTDPQGMQHEFTFSLLSRTFPLKAGIFNPNIVGEGYFNEATLELKTASKGEAGWEYSALDLSNSNYIVVELAEKPTTSVKLMVYDAQSSYSRTITGATTKLRLSNLKSIDRSAITRISFQTDGDKTLKLKAIYLSDDGNAPTGIDEILGSDDDADAPVFDLSGRRIPAKEQLRAGVYVKNGKKIVVK